MNRALLLRSAVATVLLLSGWFSLHAFQSHVQAPGPLPSVALQQSLESLPRQLGDWEGTDRPVTDPRSLYADQHLQRLYVNTKSQQSLLVWIAYSEQGEDRGHHPEVCMAVAGRPEDPSARAAINVPGHAAPIQQYRFGTAGERQWVFYWHYTLVPRKTTETTELQRFYQRLHRRPSSVTLEVFAPERVNSDADGAREFVALLDKAIQPHLGDTAVRGSQRLPVTVLRADPPTDAPTPP